MRLNDKRIEQIARKIEGKGNRKRIIRPDTTSMVNELTYRDIRIK